MPFGGTLKIPDKMQEADKEREGEGERGERGGAKPKRNEAKPNRTERGLKLLLIQ